MSFVECIVIVAALLDLFYGGLKPIQICETEALKARYILHIAIVYGLLAQMILYSPSFLYFVLILLKGISGLDIRNEIRRREKE